MTLLRSPAVVLTERDATWIAYVMRDLLQRGYFARTPHLAQRATALVSDCQQVVTSGQDGADGRGMSDDALMTYVQAARALNVSIRTLRRHVAAGTVPVTRVGRLVRFSRADLAEVSWNV